MRFTVLVDNQLRGLPRFVWPVGQYVRTVHEWRLSGVHDRGVLVGLEIFVCLDETILVGNAFDSSGDVRVASWFLGDGKVVLDAAKRVDCRICHQYFPSGSEAKAFALFHKALVTAGAPATRLTIRSRRVASARVGSCRGSIDRSGFELAPIESHDPRPCTGSSRRLPGMTVG